MEAGAEGETSSPYFWLNSGGKFIMRDGIGLTVQGELRPTDGTRLLYSAMNPLDTDDGYHPQNTLRLVTRADWQDIQESVSFNIKRLELSDTPNRDGYSGVFLFGRYYDSDNLYYVGIRQDGQAVIKKKIGGVYYTLASKQLFGSIEDYDRFLNPNLMPENTWMGLRATFDNYTSSSVRVRLYIDRHNTGRWEYVMTTIDKGAGGPALVQPGKAGIRSDYMDMQFDNLDIRSI
jgi:hypothetical protein